jgi:hypothetical protein
MVSNKNLHLRTRIKIYQKHEGNGGKLHWIRFTYTYVCETQFKHCYSSGWLLKPYLNIAPEVVPAPEIMPQHCT